MSRNYELLTRMGYEFGEVEVRPRTITDRAAERGGRQNRFGGYYAQELLRLIQNIFLIANGKPPRQVTFCGVDEDSGSSSICAGAARTLVANSSRSVCLVDANLQFSRLSSLFEVDRTIPSTGNTACMRDRCVQIGVNLWLAMPSLLTDDNGALLSADKLKHFLADLRSAFDFVLIDAPGTSVSGVATTLGQASDAMVLVIEANETRRLSARRAKESLDGAGIRLLGLVLHNRSFPIPEGLYKRL